MDARIWRNAGLLLLSATALVPAASAQDRPAGAAAPLPAAPAESADPLLDGFRIPPQAARPQVWWHLMNGNVAQEGMDLDLDWLARMGIGGVHAFSGALLEPTVVPRPLPFMSEGWRDAFRHAVSRARTLGMEVTIAGSPGWSQTGGPWVAPADAMKKFVWSETPVRGGGRRSLTLAPLPDGTGPFQNTPPAKAGKLKVVPTLSGNGPVLAFPAASLPTPVIRSNGTVIEGLADAPLDLGRATPIALDAAGRAVIDVTFARPVPLQALSLALGSPVPFEIAASADGVAFVPVGRYEVPEGEAPNPQQTVTFTPVTVRAMRVTLLAPPPRAGLPGIPMPPAKPPKSAVLRLLRFSAAPRVARFETKAGFEPTVAADAHDAPTTTGVDPARVIDLTSRVSADGRLDWNAPRGDWVVVRLGWSLTGRTNAPAEPEATGLEVDKLDRAAVTRYIDTYLDKYRRDAGVPMGREGISGLLTDSWEVGTQNWTSAILADFRRLRGYDPLPWLPVLAGYVVQDSPASDAFLADFRQTLKDLVVANHYAVLAGVAHANGMTYSTEVQGDLPRAIVDGLTAKGQSDIPTAEYWFRPFTAGPGQPPLLADLREAASAAHLYGRPMAAAESLTMAAFSDPWSTAPNVLKPVVDRIFANGINRILIHDSHHQPFVDRKPGLQLAIFGQWFNRNETWAEQARGWTDYLARTSFLLQQGRYIADVAYLYGEEQALTALFNTGFNTAVPAGHGYDYMDAATLLSNVTVADGAAATASGMRYPVLYLGAGTRRLSLRYLSKLAELVEAGATLVGEPPEGKLGLAESDAAFRDVVARLWPTGAADHALGKGRVLRTTDLAAALSGLGIVRDVALPEGSDVLSLHRRTPAADLYYLANQSVRPMRGTVRFRTTGAVPQWWSPETAATRSLPYRDDGTTTAVELDLLPEQAGFVVFRPATGARPAPARNAATAMAELPVTGAWDVDFEAGRGAPATARFADLHDWSTDPLPGIRYFSGAATYRKTITLPRTMAGLGRVLLDLGTVHEIASVTVNGVPAGTAWHAPYRLDITRLVRPGRNRVEIKVANLWVNRLIGDKQPGATAIAYAPQATYRASSKLRPSGLIGPVSLRQESGEDGFAFDSGSR